MWDTGPATRGIRDGQRKIQGVRSMGVSLVRQVPIILGSARPITTRPLDTSRYSFEHYSTIGDIEKDKEQTFYL